MKEVLSVVTFGIGAVGFVLFVAVLKPNSIGAAAGTGTPEYCNADGLAPLRGRVDSSCGHRIAGDRNGIRWSSKDSQQSDLYDNGIVRGRLIIEPNFMQVRQGASSP
ncbi:MAG: hypothetical protein QOJ86_5262 [Bradyrhizobium sp.]|jgi:hypothetical protein|nr:hypothetical protein [Bradyrhizobium sp.]